MSPAEPFSSLEEEVSNTFVQRLHGEWTVADQAALESRLASDSAYADAYRLAEESMQLLGAHVEMPEMMKFRERAIAHARRSSANRWFGSSFDHRNRGRLVAGIACAFIVLASAWQLPPWGLKPGQYRTSIGEQRIIELEDHSRIAMDAATRIVVRYTSESRTVELIEGQAQFSVAKNHARPFKVKAGDRTIVALGTVFTVEYSDERVRVAMLEGRVAVVPQSTEVLSLISLPRLEGEARNPHASSAAQLSKNAGFEPIELFAGEELRVSQDGRTTFTQKADLEAVTAWRSGKVVLRTERLGDAIRRINRYSRVQVEVEDPALADETISGVFEAGDTQGFVGAVQFALPVVADYSGSNTVRLSFK